MKRVDTIVAQYLHNVHDFAAHYRLAYAQSYRRDNLSAWSDIDLEWENVQAAADWVASQWEQSQMPEIGLLAAAYATALAPVVEMRVCQKVDAGWQQVLLPALPRATARLKPRSTTNSVFWNDISATIELLYPSI